MPYAGFLTVYLNLPGGTNAYYFGVGSKGKTTNYAVPWGGAIIKRIEVNAGDTFSFGNGTGDPNLIATTFVLCLQKL